MEPAMTSPLFLILWISGLTSLLLGSMFIHQQYTEAIKSDINEFETQWRQLEESKKSL
jgi:hypothetical protein